MKIPAARSHRGGRVSFENKLVPTFNRKFSCFVSEDAPPLLSNICIFVASRLARKSSRKPKKKFKFPKNPRIISKMDSSDSSPPELCRNLCGFYASPRTAGLCSVCHKKWAGRSSTPSPAGTSSSSSPSGTSASFRFVRSDRQSWSLCYLNVILALTFGQQNCKSVMISLFAFN